MNLPPTNFVPIECASCHCVFYISKRMQEARRNDHKGFYCPNGHNNWYAAESDLEKERRLRQRAEQRIAQEIDEKKRLRQTAQHQERRASAFKGQCTRIKNRVGRGICPCCNRSFLNLQQHMKNQHPKWSPDDETDEKKSA